MKPKTPKARLGYAYKVKSTVGVVWSYKEYATDVICAVIPCYTAAEARKLVVAHNRRKTP